jgi:hypothetical protein
VNAKLASPHLIAPVIAPTADLSPGLAVAFNAMLENQALSLGVAGALTTSLDRASAAETAGSTAARDRQLEAARSYARQWAELLRPAGNLRTAVASAMRTEYPWMHGASITDLRVQRDEIWTNGWPQAVYEIAEAYTENSSERDLLLKEMSQRLGFISSFTSSPIDILEARNLGPHEQKTAQVLNRFAAAPRRRGSIGSVDPG